MSKRQRIVDPTEGIIYVATNLLNGKSYVGQTIVGLQERIACHLAAKHSYHFTRSLRKYGAANFRFIEIPCPRKELNRWERFFIDILGTLHPCGYNHTNGGDAKFETSQEARRRLSEATRGAKNPYYGRKHSLATRKKISENHADFSGKNHPQFGKGHRMSESYRLRRKVMMMGEGNPFYGKHHTQETREKISIQRRGRPLSEEHKRRIGIGVRRYLERQKEIS